VFWGSSCLFDIVCVEAVFTGLVLCVAGQCLLDCYCVCWGSYYWFNIVCVGAGITGLVLCVGQ